MKNFPMGPLRPLTSFWVKNDLLMKSERLLGGIQFITSRFKLINKRRLMWVSL